MNPARRPKKMPSTKPPASGAVRLTKIACCKSVVDKKKMGGSATMPKRLKRTFVVQTTLCVYLRELSDPDYATKIATYLGQRQHQGADCAGKGKGLRPIVIGNQERDIYQ